MVGWLVGVCLSMIYDDGDIRKQMNYDDYLRQSSSSSNATAKQLVKTVVVIYQISSQIAKLQLLFSSYSLILPLLM